MRRRSWVQVRPTFHHCNSCSVCIIVLYMTALYRESTLLDWLDCTFNFCWPSKCVFYLNRLLSHERQGVYNHRSLECLFNVCSGYHQIAKPRITEPLRAICRYPLRFKNTYELLNLGALKFSPMDKIYFFQCMGKVLCVEFHRYHLQFHTQYVTHTLKDMILYNIKILRVLRF